MKKKPLTATSDVSDIDQYIAGFPAETQTLLQQTRRVIRDAAPAATETIKYRIPTFVQNGNLVHFAAFERHLGFYPTPSAMVRFQQQLKTYVTAKGSVQFPWNQPIPWDLIREMVLFRVSEVSGSEGRPKKQTRPASNRKPDGPAKTAKASEKTAARSSAGRRRDVLQPTEKPTADGSRSTSPKARSSSARRSAAAKTSPRAKRSK